MRRCRSSLLSCSQCKNKCILWTIQVNFKKWNRITVGDRLAFPVSLQWFQVLVPCSAATNACFLTHGTHRDYTETFLVVNFLRLIHPEIMKVVEYEFFNARGVSAEFLWLDSKDSPYRNCNSTNSLIHNRFWCGKFDSQFKWLPSARK